MISETVRIERWGPRDLLRRIHDAMAIYAEAMAYPAETGRAHASFTASHASRRGFRAVAALADDALTGFGYGYTSVPGQWWHDQVRSAIPDPQRASWLTDCFELCELHVAPGWQGQGIGRRLLTALAADVPERRMLLSTPEGPTRARRLYRSVGFVELAGNHFFPGDGRPFAILGVELPLA